jgi:hypothetical protein
MTATAAIVSYWRTRYGMNPGQRNANLLVLAFQLNKHGVPMAEALGVCLPMQQEGFPADEVRGVVESAYRSGQVGCSRGCRWCGMQAPPPPSAYRVNSGFTLTAEQRAKLVAAVRQAKRQQLVSSTAPMPLPPSVSSSTATAQPQQPVSTSPPAAVHEGTTPEPVAIVQGDERPAAAPVGTSPAEQVHQRSTHDDGAVTLLRCMQRKHPYTMALELYVQAGVNLTGARVAQLLRDMDNELASN